MLDFNALADRWRGRARVAMVYLSEAHAADEWPMGRHVVVLQHKDIEQRARAAREFVSSTGLMFDDIFLDNMNDAFMHAFSAHPQRFFVIDAGGLLRFKAAPFEGEYTLADVDQALEQVCGGR